MKQIERQKTQKIIDKIQTGNFNENDVDNLFMKLRAYSKGFKVFKEISDFVAHNDARDRGLTNESLEYIYLSTKFYKEFHLNNKIIDVSNPFPTWIKKFMIYQIDKSDELILKEKFKVNKERLKVIMKKGFKDNNDGNCILLEGKLSVLTSELSAFALSFIIIKEAYSQNELIDETIKVIQKNNLEIEVSEFEKQSNYFTLCTLLLLHNTKFCFQGYKEAYCQISFTNATIHSDDNIINENNNENLDIDSYGNITILSYVTLSDDLTIACPIMSTNLKASKYCDKSLFDPVSMVGDGSGNLTRFLYHNENIKISQNQQLIID